MAKSQRKKRLSKEEQVKLLMIEIKRNDEVLRKNKEDYDDQVMAGLYMEKYPPEAPLYSTFLEKMELDLEEVEIALASDMEIVNPMFKFQADPRWLEIQQVKQKKQAELLKVNITDLGKMIAKVKNDIETHNGRMVERRIQILEDLAGLGEDVSELKAGSPNYIG